MVAVNSVIERKRNAAGVAEKYVDSLPDEDTFEAAFLRRSCSLPASAGGFDLVLGDAFEVCILDLIAPVTVS